MKKLVHASRIGAIVATVRYGDNPHNKSSYIKGQYWFHVRLNKKNCLKCDCGGFVKKYTDDFDYVDSDACSHIDALYGGRITTDMKDTSGDYVANIRRVQWSRPFVKLTVLGERMFFWRWTTQALEVE